MELQARLCKSTYKYKSTHAHDAHAKTHADTHTHTHRAGCLLALPGWTTSCSSSSVPLQLTTLPPQQLTLQQPSRQLRSNGGRSTTSLPYATPPRQWHLGQQVRCTGGVLHECLLRVAPFCCDLKVDIGIRGRRCVVVAGCVFAYCGSRVVI
jgi:hypothetical protein